MNCYKKLILTFSVCVLSAVVSMPASAVSDLAVSGSGTSDRWIPGYGYTFNVVVTNNGPDTATGVNVQLNALAGQGIPPRIATSQGTCTQVYGPNVCDLGTLLSGTTVSITASWSSGSSSLSLQVQGNETDPDLANNSITITAAPPPATTTSTTTTSISTPTTSTTNTTVATTTTTSLCNTYVNGTTQYPYSGQGSCHSYGNDDGTGLHIVRDQKYCQQHMKHLNSKGSHVHAYPHPMCI